MAIATMPIRSWIPSAQSLPALELAVQGNYAPTDPIWTQIQQTVPIVEWAVVDPASGPGVTQVPDWPDTVARLRARGTKVLGLIDIAGLSSGTFKSSADVNTEIAKYKAFYGVDGVLLQVLSSASGCAAGSQVEQFVSYARSLSLVAAVNIGFDPADPCLYSSANVDILMTRQFIGATALADYQAYTPPVGQATATAKIWNRLQVPAADIPAVRTQAIALGTDILTVNDTAQPFTVIPQNPFWTAVIAGIQLAPGYTPQPLPVPNIGANQTLAIPSYWDPTVLGTGTKWDNTVALGANTGVVVLNPDTGPGLFPNANTLANVTAAQAVQQNVFGYVSTCYIGRVTAVSSAPTCLAKTVAGVKSQIDDYFTWYPTINGIFLDEGNDQCVDGATQSALANYVHTTYPGKQVILNSGKNVAEDYVSGFGLGASFAFDIIVNFEGSAASYTPWQPAWWVYAYPANRFWHIVYDAADSVRPSIVAASKTRQAGNLYVTNLPLLPNPFADLPSYVALVSGAIHSGESTTANPVARGGSSCAFTAPPVGPVVTSAPTTAAPTTAAPTTAAPTGTAGPTTTQVVIVDPGPVTTTQVVIVDPPPVTTTQNVTTTTTRAFPQIVVFSDSANDVAVTKPTASVTSIAVPTTVVVVPAPAQSPAAPAPSATSKLTATVAADGLVAPQPAPVAASVAGNEINFAG
jgi:Spherulation-specific family 4